MKALRKILGFLSILSLTISCSPELTDNTTFSLHYYDAEVIIGGSSVILSPSYIGDKPTDFRIDNIIRNGMIEYDPILDGPLTEKDIFYIYPDTGDLIIQKTAGKKAGTYHVSISCSSAGKSYSFPELITLKMLSE